MSRPHPPFFFNDTATTEIYTLSLHDALPISSVRHFAACNDSSRSLRFEMQPIVQPPDRKSTRLNSSHPSISYAVFCLKKKKRKEGEHASRKPSCGVKWGEESEVNDSWESVAW